MNRVSHASGCIERVNLGAQSGRPPRKKGNREKGQANKGKKKEKAAKNNTTKKKKKKEEVPNEDKKEGQGARRSPSARR